MPKDEKTRTPVTTNQVFEMLGEAVENRAGGLTDLYHVFRVGEHIELFPLAPDLSKGEAIGVLSEYECAEGIPSNKLKMLVNEATRSINESRIEVNNAGEKKM